MSVRSFPGGSRRSRPAGLRRAAAALVAATAAAVTVVATALPAAAHVTVSPSSAPAGGYATLTFKVPTESDTASTTGLTVAFPTDTPIASVSIQPKAGWRYEVKKDTPSQPLTVHGAQINEIVTEVAWTVDGSAGIAPGEFDTFVVSAGPLPEDVDTLTFKVLQSYSDGEVVRWIDESAPGQPEPEYPAPTLTLTAAEHNDDAGQPAAEPVAAPAATEPDSSDGTARALGIAGLVVGALGLAVGGIALAGARRRGGPAAG
ncbi:MAG: YcnI family protein [Frankia sp.]|nr:YcnI family protein [Frankia sp.]